MTTSILEDPVENKNPRTILATLAVVVVMTIVDGWVISELWKWFVVPLGVRAIGVAHGCGIDVLARVAIPHTRASKVQTTISALLAAWFWRTIVLCGVGYIAHVVM